MSKIIEVNQAAILKSIIENRRSVFPKNYTGERIDEQIIEEIVSSATFAPQHKKTRPWRFKVFRDEEKFQLGQELARIYKATFAESLFLEKKYADITNKISKTDVIITLSVNFSGLVPEWEEIAAVSMAVQNMYLTASVNEVGCYWSSPGIIKHLDQYLGLNENQKCYGLFYMGKI